MSFIYCFHVFLSGSVFDYFSVFLSHAVFASYILFSVRICVSLEYKPFYFEGSFLFMSALFPVCPPSDSLVVVTCC